MVLCCLGGITFPTISSINANNVDEHEQGQIQGALYGARALSVCPSPGFGRSPDNSHQGAYMLLSHTSRETVLRPHLALLAGF